MGKEKSWSLRHHVHVRGVSRHRDLSIRQWRRLFSVLRNRSFRSVFLSCSVFVVLFRFAHQKERDQSANNSHHCILWSFPGSVPCYRHNAASTALLATALLDNLLCEPASGTGEYRKWMNAKVSRSQVFSASAGHINWSADSSCYVTQVLNYGRISTFGTRSRDTPERRGTGGMT